MCKGPTPKNREVDIALRMSRVLELCIDAAEAQHGIFSLPWVSLVNAMTYSNSKTYSRLCYPGEQYPSTPTLYFRWITLFTRRYRCFLAGLKNEG